MYPRTHFLLGLAASIFLFFIFPNFPIEGIILFFLASFLIDFDHYLYFVYKRRSLNPIWAIKWYKEKVKFVKKLTLEKRNKHAIGFYCFHGLEWVFLFTLLGYFVLDWFYFIALGMGFHLILDYLWIFKNKLRVSKISAIWDLIKYKKLKKL